MKKINNYLAVDENKNEWFIPSGLFGKKKNVYKISDILDFELIENNSNITKSGIGGAVIGGILLGIPGAIVGGCVSKKNKNVCDSLVIKITLKNNSIVYIKFIEAPIEKSNIAYDLIFNKAQECLALLQMISHLQKGV